MTTLTDFSVMTFEKKCDIVAFKSNFLMHRIIGKTKIFLYESAGFFIEVFYSSERAEVLMINAFANVNNLDAYLSEIELTDLNIN